MIRPAARSAVAPFHVMDVVRAAKRRQAERGDAILLCVGQPSTPAPRVVREAVVAAVRGEVLGYTESAGTPAVRDAVAGFFARRYDVALDPGQVVVSPGSSGAFTTLLLTAFAAGDRVAMTRPGYPAYRNALHAHGLQVVDLVCGADTRYQPSIAQLEAAMPLGGVVLASPANPTGTIIDPAELAAIAAWCEANDVLLISDEIYHGISFGRPCTTARASSPAAVVLGSVSKYQSMTGWRLGWMVLPPALVAAADRLQANLSICAPAVSQAAAIAALDASAEDELDAHVDRYARNRDLLLRRLPELGITSFAPPDGAFYAYCDIGHLTQDSLSWCRDLLERTGVALAPGVDFDPVEGGRFVRLSFCGETDELDTALDRIVAAI